MKMVGKRHDTNTFDKNRAAAPRLWNLAISHSMERPVGERELEALGAQHQVVRLCQHVRCDVHGRELSERLHMANGARECLDLAMLAASDARQVGFQVLRLSYLNMSQSADKYTVQNEYEELIEPTSMETDSSKFERCRTFVGL